MHVSYGLLGAFIALTSPTVAWSTPHDAGFQPEYILRATAQNVTFDCESRYSVVFNGTSPGPPLYMQEGRTTWVRVYNDMTNENLTVCLCYSNITNWVDVA